MLIIFIALLGAITAFAAPGGLESAWAWERYEASQNETISMSGDAVLLRQSKFEYIFLLSDRTAQLETFKVSIRVGKDGHAIATFEPPNSEKVKLQVTGRRYQSPSNNHIQFVLSSAENGNFLVIRSSRVRR
jgi:hypothetical protein